MSRFTFLPLHLPLLFLFRSLCAVRCGVPDDSRPA